MKTYYYNLSARVGDLLIESDLGWSLALVTAKKEFSGGSYGWDPTSLAMHGIFYAKGPDFKPHNSIGTIENVNIYSAVLKVLGLEIPEEIDGKLKNIKAALKEVSK